MTGYYATGDPCRSASEWPFNRGSRLAHPMLKGSVMKDLMFILVTGAFFAVCWLYARSFDHL